MPTLMVSISGIRGLVGDGLDPQVLVRFTSAYAKFVKSGTVVLGRDSRISGEMVKHIVAGTLMSHGLDVIDIGIVPTPTVLYAVNHFHASGGIQISASHNPNEWNALKLLNRNGEFMTPEEHQELKQLLDEEPSYKRWDELGTLSEFPQAVDLHMESVLNLPFINVEAIRNRKFKVLVDCVNGAGSWCVPDFLRQFGCDVIEFNCEKTGIFPRLAEPLPENLVDTMEAVRIHKADMGIVVDPDVDRLVLITEQGLPFSEENTIAQAVKFLLARKKGNVVVNLSTTRAVEDIAAEFGCSAFRAPVGEANVVKKMKEVQAVIGGEGSGGVIFPELVYGRDALIGIGLLLQHLLEFGGTLSELKASLPAYEIAKKKIDLIGVDPDTVLEAVKQKYAGNKMNTDDGLRLDFEDHWVHFRKSNTEPIIRVITEAATIEKAESYISNYFGEISGMMKK